MIESYPQLVGLREVVEYEINGVVHIAPLDPFILTHRDLTIV